MHQIDKPAGANEDKPLKWRCSSQVKTLHFPFFIVSHFYLPGGFLALQDMGPSAVYICCMAPSRNYKIWPKERRINPKHYS